MYIKHNEAKFICFTVNIEKKTPRQMRPVAALCCESDHVFTAPITALYRSVSQRYLMGRAKERGSAGPQPPSVNNGSPQTLRPGPSQS